MLGAEFIRVTARVRPSASRIPQERILEVLDDKNLCFDPRNPRNFAFDAVFGEDVDQEQIYDEVASRIIDGCINGYNGTIFAYGQTGSGKTHTMLGPHHVENFMLNPAQRGLIPRACEALFQKLCTQTAEKGENFKYEVWCKFVELYNEDFYDLLGNSQQKLAIRSDSTVVQILGVSEHSVHSSIDMMRILEVGWDARRTAETAMNRESSRSHAIFIVEVHLMVYIAFQTATITKYLSLIKTEELVNTIVNKRTAILNLVDLAGSERQSQAKTVGARFREATKINLSLTHLGRVIRTLAKANHGDTHVPYRDSKLTHILRDSLGGNSRTAVIVNLHPDKGYYTETLSTLQFSSNCRKIENKVHANEDLSGDTVMAYKAEIKRLREELGSIEGRVRAEMEGKVAAMQEEIEQWKQLAIARERDLVEAQLQRDLFAAQLPSGSSNEGERPQDEILNELKTKIGERIDSIKDYKELSRTQLENDLSNALRELDQMRVRFENAEAARKALNEKYKNVLEGVDETLASPLRRLNLNATPTTGRRKTGTFNSAAQKKKERRQTLFTPKNAADRASRAFRPVLFDDSTEENTAPEPQLQNLEQDEEMAEERKLLRLEMDNNRLSQILTEKESQIESLSQKQKEQANIWLEEKQALCESESALKTEVEQLCLENCGLLEKLTAETRRNDVLSLKISSANDEKCQLKQQIDVLQAEKDDLEDKIQILANEREQFVSELRSLADLESAKINLENELRALQQDNVNVKERNHDLEEKCKAQSDTIATLEVALTDTERSREDGLSELMSRHAEELRFVQTEVESERAAHLETKEIMRSKDDEIARLGRITQEQSSALRARDNEIAELQDQMDEWERMAAQKAMAFKELEQKREEEISNLKRRHAEEVKDIQSQIDREQSAHNKTRQQFAEFRQSAQDTFDRKMAELRETFSSKERRLTVDREDKEHQIIRLTAEKDSLLQEYNEMRAHQTQLEEELQNKKKENEILRAEKEEGDKAIVELAGHNNHRQKVSYIEKVRLENHNLKMRVAELEKEVIRLRVPVTRSRRERITSGRSTPRPQSSQENEL